MILVVHGGEVGGWGVGVGGRARRAVGSRGGGGVGGVCVCVFFKNMSLPSIRDNTRRSLGGPGTKNPKTPQLQNHRNHTKLIGRYRKIKVFLGFFLIIIN